MKKETLERGTLLVRRIEKLEKHIEDVANHAILKSQGYAEDSCAHSLRMAWNGSENTGNFVWLWDDFLNWNDFKMLYLMRAEKQLKELKEELESL